MAEIASSITLESNSIRVTLEIDADGVAYLREVRLRNASSQQSQSPYFSSSALPLVEVRLAGEGTKSFKSSKALVGTALGARLKYQAHHERAISPAAKMLDVTLYDDVSQITVISHLTVYDNVPVLRSSSTVRNGSTVNRVIVTQLSSLVLGGLTISSDEWWSGYVLSTANNTWFREAQWSEHSLPDIGIDDAGLHELDEGHSASLAHFSLSNRGTFSTEGHLPMGMLKRRDNRDTWLWQVENNGSWRWEIGDYKDSVYLAATGPEEYDHDWRLELAPGASFSSVPAALCRVSDGPDAAFAALTQYRRMIRRQHLDNDRLPIIFNDYMNCLMGDPTDQKILALLEPVSRVGAEYFVIDAGWYADDSDWWDDVGQWEPSKKRFPMGFGNLITKIKEKGLIPGLWVEPEVVGVRSAVAQQLPPEAFFQRNGQRIVEKGRYQLDYRHPAVQKRMHGVIGNLVEKYGIGYFKFDYNIDVTQGTDIDCSSPGVGQLDHNRAYLRWVGELHDKFPHMVIENCSSGAQRMDYAMLAVHALQSTSDQQDPVRYGAIAASIPTAVTPEQGATWAYPQPEWDMERNAMTVVNSLLGRIHLSGRLDLLSPQQFKLINEGMSVYKSIRNDLPTALAFWPLGLPHWHDGWVALGMAVRGTSGSEGLSTCYVSVWRRHGPQVLRLPIRPFEGRSYVSVELLYPSTFVAETTWLPSSSSLEVKVPSTVCARLFRLRMGNPKPV